MRYLVPIAAPEDLFPRKDFHFPKPQIEIDGRPMIARVIENLSRNDPAARFIFVVRAQDCRQFSLDDTLALSAPGDCVIVQQEAPAAGAACSALMAIDHIDDDEPLVIANGDQLFDYDLGLALADFERRGLDAAVVTFPSVHPRWSYVRLDETGAVTEAAEKRVISRNAVAGVYYFRRGADFVRWAKASILSGRSVDGKFFIAPTLNEAILEGRTVGVHAIPESAYHSLYSPQRLELYERDLQAARAARGAGGAVQLVIPMAGRGSRFAEAGYERPKPLIDVAGAPMIARVIDNLRAPGARTLLIARQDLVDAEPEFSALTRRARAEILPIDLVTEGAACTVLLARAWLDPDAPLLLANCDQIVDFDCAAFVADAQGRDLDGSILCFREPGRDPKWSFARTGADGLVTEVREKQPISDLATVGLYYFARARDFIDFAVDMIARNERVNGEFYVAPVYNHAIAAGARIGVYEVAAEAMHGLGTPDDLQAYLKTRA